MVTKEELLNLAMLSKLDISSSNIDRLLKDMEEVIEFADKINSVSNSDSEFDNINNLQNVYRDDNVIDSYPQDEILKNSKTVESGFFRIDNHSQMK